MPSFLTSALSGVIGRIVLLAALAALPIAVILLQAFVEMRTLAVERAVEDLQHAVRAEADDLDEAFSSVAQLLSTVALLPFFSAGSADCEQRLAAIHSSVAPFQNLFIADAAGEIVCSAPPLKNPVNIADRTYFKSALGSSAPVFGEVVTSRDTGQPIMPVAVLLRGEQGGASGIAGSAMDTGAFLAQVAARGRLDDTVLSLWDSDGRLLARLPHLPDAIGKAWGDTPIFRAIYGDGGRRAHTGVDAQDGIERINAIAGLERGGSRIWLSAGVVRSAIVDPIDRAFLYRIGLLAAGFTLVLAIAAGLGHVIVRAPLRQLSSATLKRVSGAAGPGLLLHSGAREIIALGGDIHRLADTLYQRIDAQIRACDDLRAAKDAAEETIVARTRQLEHISREASERSAALAETSFNLSTLSQMTDMLQTATDLSDAGPIIELAAQRLFPQDGGAAFLFRDSRNLLEPICAWGGFPKAQAFVPEDCLAIRLGYSYRVSSSETKARCRHVEQDVPDYICVPMSAQGNVLGVFTCALGPDEAANAAVVQIAGMAAERCALALANVMLRQQLRESSTQDSLTGLYNRRFAKDVLTRELIRADREGTTLCVFMLDLDHFKKVNDTYGHEVGDQLLQKVGAILQASFRGSDVCCRYGGEEFLVILPNSDADGALRRAEGLRKAVKRISFVHKGTPVGNMTVSIGLASFPDPISDASSLVGAADTALYEAKETGRDRICVAPSTAADGTV